MVRFMNADEAVACIRDNSTVMSGGFGPVGNPFTLLDALCRSPVSGLTWISNSLGEPKDAFGKFVRTGKIKSAKGSIFNRNPEAIRMFREGKMDIEVMPMGNFVEKIRAGGAGLGGFYSPVGVGTIYEEGREKRVINGREYLLEYPFTADFALIYATKADRLGNLVYAKTTKNFNPIMATAAKITIAEVEEVVETGGIDPEEIMTPFVYVDIIVPKRELQR